MLYLSFDIGGFFSCFAGASSVFDVLDVLEKVVPFFLVVSGSCAEWLWEQRGHSMGTSASDSEKDVLFGFDMAEVVNAWAEGGVEVFGFTGVGIWAVLIEVWHRVLLEVFNDYSSQ